MNYEIEKPIEYETPLWVKNFIVFICSDWSKEDWTNNLSKYERE
jgi:hypothetical protein